MLKVGFIGLGNVGGKLAGSLLRNGFDLTVRDLERDLAQPFLDQGAHWGESPRQMAEDVELIITCLPNPAASANVMEAENGILAGLSRGKIWAEMSTTDEAEVKRLGALVQARGANDDACRAGSDDAFLAPDGGQQPDLLDRRCLDVTRAAYPSRDHARQCDERPERHGQPVNGMRDRRRQRIGE